MVVTSYQDFDLADADREWDAAEKRVRKWADAEDRPEATYRDAHVWYDVDLSAEPVERCGSQV